MMNMKARFRGFLPIVVDVETGGLDADKHSLLEIAAYQIRLNSEQKTEDKDVMKRFELGAYCHYHIEAESNLLIDEAALKVNQIIPDHPFRFSCTEKLGLKAFFEHIQAWLDEEKCRKSFLVGHNAGFDLSFIKAAARRQKWKHIPFHHFSTLDTVTLSAAHLGETVLEKALQRAGIEFDNQQAHGALYDARKTAELFCYLMNRIERYDALKV